MITLKAIESRLEVAKLGLRSLVLICIGNHSVQSSSSSAAKISSGCRVSSIDSSSSAGSFSLSSLLLEVLWEKNNRVDIVRLGLLRHEAAIDQETTGAHLTRQMKPPSQTQHEPAPTRRRRPEPKHHLRFRAQMQTLRQVAVGSTGRDTRSLLLHGCILSVRCRHGYRRTHRVRGARHHRARAAPDLPHRDRPLVPARERLPAPHRFENVRVAETSSASTARRASLSA